MSTRLTPDLRLLLATSCTGRDQQAAAVIAQLAGTLRVDVTVAHVVTSRQASPDVDEVLDAVLAERHASYRCRRMLIESLDPSGAIAEVCGGDRFDLVMAPAAHGSVRQLLRPSFRAQLLRRCAVPLWTAGVGLPAAERPIRTVACLLDFADGPARFLRLASAFAGRLGARLQILAVLPAVDEGTLHAALASEAPLLPPFAVNRIQALYGGSAPPDIDVAIGLPRRELPRMLTRHRADLLFVSPGQWAAAGWRGYAPRSLDRLPCPVICLSGSRMPGRGWSFQDVTPAPRPWTMPARALVAAG